MLRLVADEAYFGLEARSLRAGLERALARMAANPSSQAHLDVAAFAEDFRLIEVDALTLLHKLVAGGLVQVDTSNVYAPTSLFGEYANATVVAPLSRARAKVLLERTAELASEINAKWHRNRFRIRMIAVSGTYMSRRAHLTDLTLSIMLRGRPDVCAPQWKRAPSRAEALGQILHAVRAQSSFIVARVVADKEAMPRPFAVVYQAGDPIVDDPVNTWDRFRDWGASISRRLGAK